jgi:putative flippase GtrA
LARTVVLELSGRPSSSELQQKEYISRLPTQHLEPPKKSWQGLFWQLFRFCLVGGLNTGIDLLILNVLLWIWPTQNTEHLLAYNSFAYAFGAINSFILNKYWTFRNKQQTTYGEILRFALTTACGIICNDIILWIAGTFLHPVMINPTLWANASKVLAISGTFMISYLGMRLWVFTRQPGRTQ